MIYYTKGVRAREDNNIGDDFFVFLAKQNQVSCHSLVQPNPLFFFSSLFSPVVLFPDEVVVVVVVVC